MRKAVVRTAVAILFIVTASQAQTLDQTISGCNGVAPTRTIQANPSNYRSFLAGLLPGDRLQLAAGTYTTGLNLWNKSGQPGKCIVIEGPASGSPALFLGSSSWNTVRLKNSGYIAGKKLTLGGQGRPGGGDKGEAGGTRRDPLVLEKLARRAPHHTVQPAGSRR